MLTVSLLGLQFLVLVVSIAVLVCVAVALLWNRWPRLLRWPMRLSSVALVMLAGALVAGTVVNRGFAFYSSVDDLLATPARTYQPPVAEDPATAAGVEILTPNWQQLGKAAAAQGRGTVVQVRIPGPRSGLDRPGLVYLPAAWFLDRGRALPTIELFPGYPGRPGDYLGQIDLPYALDQEIAAARMPPVIGVLPSMYDGGRASECVDAVGGERNETYLAIDVPAAVQRSFHTLPGRTLGLLGYSEGGFCAANLGLHHPDRVAAAVSLSGYFTAGTDPHTKQLYRGVRGALQRNSPLWWVQHRAPTAPAMLLFASAGDRDSVQQDRALARAAATDAPKLPLAVTLFPTGGHNFGTWQRAMPAALDFLGRLLPMPLAPALKLPPDPQVRVPPAQTRVLATEPRRAGPRTGRAHQTPLVGPPLPTHAARRLSPSAPAMAAPSRSR